MPESTRDGSDSTPLLDEGSLDESAVSYTVESLNCEWEEIVRRPDGTVERRRRILRTERGGTRIDLKVILVIGLLLGLMFKPDLLAPIAQEVFKLLWSG